MTRRTNARIAGFAYLLYIAVAFPSFALFGKATAGSSVAEKLASVARHADAMRGSIILSLLSAFCALTLAVTLYAITRDEDNDLAMFGLVCRAAEGVFGAILIDSAGLWWLATTTGPTAPDAAGANALAALLLRLGSWQVAAAATLFAGGSTAFSYLLLRGRIVPVPLAWIGVVGSVLVLIVSPLELIHLVGGPLAQLSWIPVAIFEVLVAVWLIVKGAAPPLRTRSA